MKSENAIYCSAIWKYTDICLSMASWNNIIFGFVCMSHGEICLKLSLLSELMIAPPFEETVSAEQLGLFSEVDLGLNPCFTI